MISTILYYVFFSSVVLVYGIGIERSVVLSKKQHDLMIKALKMMICVSSTSALSYMIVYWLLVPVDLTELYPFVVILFFLAISVFVEAIIRITAKISAVESGIALMFIFIGLTESNSFGECVFISVLCAAAFFMIIPFVIAITRRNELNGRKQEYEKNGFILISIVIVMFLLLSWNVTWLNKGVFL
ncbi:hypothetical protein [Treponema sp.]|uniref:hypothetical protein n=1 Tax=Treponema sp. TaxID=166 RepID=UPI00298DF7B5|nr:hypothetical protein [Treponema sp.]MCQ2241472.1 hypothetical protein [Treponema sp.]